MTPAAAPRDCQELRCRIRAACNEIIEREREELADDMPVNSVAAGWCQGAMAAAEEILACLDEEEITASAEQD